MLLRILEKLPDKRRKQGKRFDLAHLIFFSIMAILSGAKSYRQISTYIKIKFKYLKRRFKAVWKSPPSYSTIRLAIHSLLFEDLEKVFREHAQKIPNKKGYCFVCIDGKALRGSFDKFLDKRATQILSAFTSLGQIILAHKKIDNDDKTNEIPLAQELIKELNLQGVIYTLDAMHCQKKLCVQ